MFLGNVILCVRSVTCSDSLSTETQQLNTVLSFVYFCYMFPRYVRKPAVVFYLKAGEFNDRNTSLHSYEFM